MRAFFRALGGAALLFAVLTGSAPAQEREIIKRLGLKM